MAPGSVDSMPSVLVSDPISNDLTYIIFFRLISTWRTFCSLVLTSSPFSLCLSLKWHFIAKGINDEKNVSLSSLAVNFSCSAARCSTVPDSSDLNSDDCLSGSLLLKASHKGFVSSFLAFYGWLRWIGRTCRSKREQFCFLERIVSIGTVLSTYFFST